MYFRAATLDDLMRESIQKIIDLGIEVKSTRGSSRELLGIILHLENPRARLSRTETKGKPFSAIGELLWYLSGTNDLAFIYYYIKQYVKDSTDGLTIYGGYGPRLLNARGKYNQIGNVIRTLKDKPTSRQAVIQIFDAKDLAIRRKEIPCTCTLQFFIRDGRLHMMTHMRSNDAFLGLPHDVFAFTMLQEIIAGELSVELGEYRHSVGSLHLYDENMVKAQEYLSEGWQSTLLPMPHMPSETPMVYVERVKEAETNLRNGNKLEDDFNTESDYWNDIVNLLKIFSLKKKNTKDKNLYISLKEKMYSKVYDIYINKIIDSLN